MDVELSGAHSLGQTVVDVWNYSGAKEDRWGPDGKNCLVAESLDVRNLISQTPIPQPLTIYRIPRFQNSSSSSWNALIIAIPSHRSTDRRLH